VESIIIPHLTRLRGKLHAVLLSHMVSFIRLAFAIYQPVDDAQSIQSSILIVDSTYYYKTNDHYTCPEYCTITILS